MIILRISALIFVMTLIFLNGKLNAQSLFPKTDAFKEYAGECIKHPTKTAENFFVSKRKSLKHILPNGCYGIKFLDDKPLTISAFNNRWNELGGSEILKKPLDFANVSVPTLPVKRSENFVKGLKELEKGRRERKKNWSNLFGIIKNKPNIEWTRFNYYLAGGVLGLKDTCQDNMNYLKQRFFMKELLLKYGFLRLGVIQLANSHAVKDVQNLVSFELRNNKPKGEICEIIAGMISKHVNTYVSDFKSKLLETGSMKFRCGTIRELLFYYGKKTERSMYRKSRPIFKFTKGNAVSLGGWMELNDPMCISWARKNVSFIEDQLRTNLENHSDPDEIIFDEIIK